MWLCLYKVGWPRSIHLLKGLQWFLFLLVTPILLYWNRKTTQNDMISRTLYNVYVLYSIGCLFFILLMYGETESQGNWFDLWGTLYPFYIPQPVYYFSLFLMHAQSNHFLITFSFKLYGMNLKMCWPFCYVFFYYSFKMQKTD